jgi:Flp pilus assembly pilin Flp
MSDLILRTAVRVRVEAYTLPETLAGYARRTSERFRREQTGAEVIEYGGILVLVGLIVALLIQLNIPSWVHDKVQTALNSILNQSGGGGGGAGGGAGSAGAGAGASLSGGHP